MDQTLPTTSTIISKYSRFSRRFTMLSNESHTHTNTGFHLLPVLGGCLSPYKFSSCGNLAVDPSIFHHCGKTWRPTARQSFHAQRLEILGTKSFFLVMLGNDRKSCLKLRLVNRSSSVTHNLAVGVTQLFEKDTPQLSHVAIANYLKSFSFM